MTSVRRTASPSHGLQAIHQGRLRVTASEEIVARDLPGQDAGHRDHRGDISDVLLLGGNGSLCTAREGKQRNGHENPAKRRGGRRAPCPSPGGANTHRMLASFDLRQQGGPVLFSDPGRLGHGVQNGRGRAVHDGWLATLHEETVAHSARLDPGSSPSPGRTPNVVAHVLERPRLGKHAAGGHTEAASVCRLR